MNKYKWLDGNSFYEVERDPVSEMQGSRGEKKLFRDFEEAKEYIRNIGVVCTVTRWSAEYMKGFEPR